jgi:hypothetical protein
MGFQMSGRTKTRLEKGPDSLSHARFFEMEVPREEDGRPLDFKGGYASAERDDVAEVLASQTTATLWPAPSTARRIIGYSGHVPRDVREARERSSASISSAVYSTATFTSAK